jgi:hypothetical protein
MRMVARSVKWLASLVLAWMVGSLPGCATMGGGGMKYLVDPPPFASEVV